jgi:hypothetical protein
MMKFILSGGECKNQTKVSVRPTYARKKVEKIGRPVLRKMVGGGTGLS